MAVVPRPSKPGVTSAGAINPEINAAKLAAPGLAAAQFAQTALNETAAFIQHKEDIKQKAADNLYNSNLTVTKYKLSKGLSTASKVFNQEAESSELEDILGVQNRLEKEYRKQHANATKDLRPADKEMLDKLMEVDMVAFRGQANVKLADRTFTVEVAAAGDILENNILDESESAKTAVQESIDILHKHFPKEEANRRIADITSKAHYKKLIVELDNAENLEDLAAIQERAEGLSDQFDPGTETSLYNRGKGRQATLITRKTRTTKDFTKLASDGKMPDPETQQEALLNGDVTEEELKELNTLARNQKNLADDKAAGEEYMKKRWSDDYKRIKDLVKDLDGNPHVTEKNLAEMERIVNASTTSSYGRAQAKTQIAGLISSALADSDNPWRNPWGGSGDMGDSFEALDDTYNPQAREAMRRGVDMLSGMMQRSGVDIPLYDNLTGMEKAVFDIYSAAQEAGEQVDPKSVDALMRANAEKLTGLIIEHALETQAAPADVPEMSQAAIDAGVTQEMWNNATPEERTLF